MHSKPAMWKNFSGILPALPYPSHLEPYFAAEGAAWKLLLHFAAIDWAARENEAGAKVVVAIQSTSFWE